METTKQHRQFEGVVVSDSAEKTVSVRVGTTKIHPKYRKQYQTYRKYAVHDEKGAAKVGDKVIFEECRPISKTKRWRLVKVVQ
ncbi:MAG: 30S ribosomal protein S17 [Candidatus Magasanikbacteria bacterium CG11_big_fil_rev_8_21_14_0_20_39_34]|uniref:Small ribosomal subunit protein uS17 n=1 Tax=Candidatus Magasanikbacteria bacterium CG11_big_fil_rev_8_21_14_0_20_39_34 TaxID=1974653 RepID=A0A2H0N454_9BACT|nr:MAG: 30S ribosomal protein S17 [Candidatus Magasanikbacteria bacterium CG11_big_fil_rev_8_21_14_0_20_39_34]